MACPPISVEVILGRASSRWLKLDARPVAAASGRDTATGAATMLRRGAQLMGTTAWLNDSGASVTAVRPICDGCHIGVTSVTAKEKGAGR